MALLGEILAGRASEKLFHDGKIIAFHWRCYIKVLCD
jgi:hypothetical protein